MGSLAWAVKCIENCRDEGWQRDSIILRGILVLQTHQFEHGQNLDIEERGCRVY